MTSQVKYGNEFSCDSNGVCHSHLSLNDVFRSTKSIGEILGIYTQVLMDIQEMKKRIDNPQLLMGTPMKLLQQALIEDESFAMVLKEILLKHGREYKAYN